MCPVAVAKEMQNCSIRGPVPNSMVWGVLIQPYLNYEEWVPSGKRGFITRKKKKGVKTFREQKQEMLILYSPFLDCTLFISYLHRAYQKQASAVSNCTL